MTTIIPAGPTYRLTLGSSTSTATTITSDVPVNAVQLGVDGSNPAQVKFFIGTNPNTSYVSWPTTSTAAYDVFVDHAVGPQVVVLPQRLASSLAPLGGFTTTVVVSGISLAGTPALYITPVQIQGN